MAFVIYYFKQQVFVTKVLNENFHGAARGPLSKTLAVERPDNHLPKIKNTSNSKPTLRKKKDLKQNKGKLENPTRIAKKNQSGGIRVGLCRAETSSQKILMIGNLSTITGTNQKCLKGKRTFFEKTSLKEKKNIITKKKKVHINKTEQISAIFNCFHRHCYTFRGGRNASAICY